MKCSSNHLVDLPFFTNLEILLLLSDPTLHPSLQKRLTVTPLCVSPLANLISQYHSWFPKFFLLFIVVRGPAYPFTALTNIPLGPNH